MLVGCGGGVGGGRGLVFFCFINSDGGALVAILLPRWWGGGTGWGWVGGGLGLPLF